MQEQIEDRTSHQGHDISGTRETQPYARELRRSASGDVSLSNLGLYLQKHITLLTGSEEGRYLCMAGDPETEARKLFAPAAPLSQRFKRKPRKPDISKEFHILDVGGQSDSDSPSAAFNVVIHVKVLGNNPPRLAIDPEESAGPLGRQLMDELGQIFEICDMHEIPLEAVEMPHKFRRQLSPREKRNLGVAGAAVVLGGALLGLAHTTITNREAEFLPPSPDPMEDLLVPGSGTVSFFDGYEKQLSKLEEQFSAGRRDFKNGPEGLTLSDMVELRDSLHSMNPEEQLRAVDLYARTITLARDTNGTVFLSTGVFPGTVARMISDPAETLQDVAASTLSEDVRMEALRQAKGFE